MTTKKKRFVWAIEALKMLVIKYEDMASLSRAVSGEYTTKTTVFCETAIAEIKAEIEELERLNGEGE